MQTFTYLYQTSSDNHGQKIGPNMYAKHFPRAAPVKLHEQYPWDLHIGGDGLLHTHSKQPTVYAPYVARPQLQYVTLFKTRIFFKTGASSYNLNNSSQLVTRMAPTYQLCTNIVTT